MLRRGDCEQALTSRNKSPDVLMFPEPRMNHDVVEEKAMKNTTARLVLTMLLVPAVGFYSPALRADLVATPDVGAQESTQDSASADRAKVQQFLERATVKERLQAMGVNGVMAAERVAAMDQQEIHSLAQRIDALPAGGNISTQEWMLIVLVAILLVVVVSA